MQQAFDFLAADIRAVAKDRPLLFLLNAGNWGDSLIREGSERFFAHYGFRYFTVKVQDLAKGRVSLAESRKRTGHPEPIAVFNGGGSYDPRYGRIPFVSQLTHHFDHTFFLPASYPAAMADADYSEKVTFYARDTANSMQNMADAKFCHDMAFFTDLSAPSPVRKNGIFMRADSERPAAAPIPKGNRDISSEGRTHTPIRRFVSEIAKHEVVFTNRLHVCICAALLGRRVHFFPNDHFKNRAVFESSLKDRFPLVSFHEHYELLSEVRPARPSLKRLLRLPR
jgi:exopolysaccharide biosynthesis predicted pyruvyltransferase EpsI